MLESKNIYLRQVEERDLERLKNWRNSPTIRPSLRQFTLLNAINQKKWLESLHARYLPEHIIFVIESKAGLLLGACGLTYINWKEGHTDVTIYIGDKDWQGKGIATEALQRLMKYGFEELRLHRLFAVIFGYNSASIKLFEKCGFKYDGVHREARFWDGRYWDEIIYSVLSQEYFKNIKDNDSIK